ncbi:MAG: type II 3-dehydroquinate dehydratase [Mesorhizobium sp.]|nr:MAG: type II 3-dehydroquinate dehydratase [Mesorhizobium sp.]RWC04015.1 MAG: type II 3-dehydroquinate dehydratase [Mesorhizobium sp.]RWK10667.1 MAG: type II 3-dehydroquinate dehydratase [Mesorhizobium sp.]RWK24837.1 MAG: type II 3-dehydroquinate dehydratase [Mesorhizobium sp.]RWK34826.1 MAG: type II 3-dehydroquinate dehydratase [Mesorhizobium sp.]
MSQLKYYRANQRPRRRKNTWGGGHAARLHARQRLRDATHHSASPAVTDSVLILNGPNLDMLGKRQPEIYGSETLADVEALCGRFGAELGIAIDFRQSDAEHEMIDWIHDGREHAAGIVINPAAYSHSSIAIMDALTACSCPIIEVHITNIHRRESFRHHSYVSEVASAVICGCGIEGYALALRRLASLLGRAPA